MDPALIVSPHLDDAVLSCGQFLAGRPDVIVATVFAGVPAVEVQTDYDARSGFADAHDAMFGRRTEDLVALSLLGAMVRHLEFLDGQYVVVSPLEKRDVLVDAIRTEIDNAGANLVLGPLGIEHPDHEDVSGAFLTAVAGRSDLNVVLYEELPGRVLWPEKAVGRLRALRRAGLEPSEIFVGTGPMDRKREAVGAYRSQAWALPTECLYVPERYWQIKP